MATIKKQKQEKRITTINLPIELYNQIQEAADREERSFSGQLAFFLRNRVVRHSTQR